MIVLWAVGIIPASIALGMRGLAGHRFDFEATEDVAVWAVASITWPAVVIWALVRWGTGVRP